MLQSASQSINRNTILIIKHQIIAPVTQYSNQNSIHQSPTSKYNSNCIVFSRIYGCKRCITTIVQYLHVTYIRLTLVVLSMHVKDAQKNN